MTRRLLGLALALAAADGSRATNLDAPADLKPINVEITTASYRGQPATRVRGRVAAGSAAGTESLALLPGTSFLNGSIEVDVAGLLDEGARADARGFIGLAFDVTPNGDRFKSFYIRPTNGRAVDQIRRNHSTQRVLERLRSGPTGSTRLPSPRPGSESARQLQRGEGTKRHCRDRAPAEPLAAHHHDGGRGRHRAVADEQDRPEWVRRGGASAHLAGQALLEVRRQARHRGGQGSPQYAVHFGLSPVQVRHANTPSPSASHRAAGEPGGDTT